MRNKIFSDNLRLLRGERKKADFARFLGISAPSYQKYEDGMVPRSDCLIAMAAKLDRDPQWLLTCESRPGVQPRTNPEDSSSSLNQNAGAPLCRYPADCDLVRELAEMRNGLATLSTQVNTLTQLLGASLRSSIEAPEKKAG
jgi:hypothetical protein